VSDTSVIVLDLFCRRFGSAEEAPSPSDAGALAASISLSSFAGALTTIIVFLPVIFLPGPLGALFGDLALSMIVSVAAGWFYAQFCLPSMFCFFMTHGIICHGRGNPKFTRLAGGRMEKVYGSFLEKVFLAPIPIIVISFLLSLAGLVLLCSRPVEFIAPDAVSEIEVTVDFPPGTSPDGTAETGIEISRVLSELPGISFLYGRMGAEADDSSRRSDPDYQKERLFFRCFLEKEGLSAEVTEKIQAAMKEFNTHGNVALNINAGPPMDRTAAILGLSSSLTFAVKGSSPEESHNRAEALSAGAGSEPLFSSIQMRPSGTRPQLKLIPRREFTASLGISASEISEAVYAASQGVVTGQMEIEGRPLHIRVSGDIPGDDPESLRNLPLSTRFGKQYSSPVFLGSLVEIKWIEAETALARLDRSDVIYLDLFPSAGMEKSMQKTIDGITGKGISRADESVFARYRSALIATVVLVLVLLYLVLGAQFESFLLPLILMLSVPFSLAGAGPALFLSGSCLDSGTILGLVALFGLSVNNGIVFFEISEEKIRSGFSPASAVYMGALERFRPVLLTTLTTVVALLPLVISPLGNSQRGMASAMLGGIVVSGFLAFFALPPVFIRFLSSKKRGIS